MLVPMDPPVPEIISVEGVRDPTPKIDAMPANLKNQTVLTHNDSALDAHGKVQTDYCIYNNVLLYDVNNRSTCESSVDSPIVSPLNYDNWEFFLSDHPDKNYVNLVLKYIKDGIPLGYTGPRSGVRICPNWASSYQLSEACFEIISKEVRLGRKIGPFQGVPPSMKDFYICSPVGAFQRSSGKTRIIHDLSWPPEGSVNNFIAKQDYSMVYISVDDAIHDIKQLLKTRANDEVYISKCDLSDAFKYILVDKNDHNLLGTSWSFKNEHGHIVTHFYYDVMLPFGSRSSPKNFDLFACGLEYVAKNRGASIVRHYMDDYFTCGDYDDCLKNRDILVESAELLGFEMNPKKVEGPTQKMEFLGLEIDVLNMCTRISEERLAKTLDELKLWVNKSKCTKRQLLSIIGKLNFISRVVRPGRTFLRSFIRDSCKVSHLGHTVKLSSQSKLDFQWWLKFLPDFNGINIFYDEIWQEDHLYFNMTSDASDLGCASVFGDKWCMLDFREHAFWKEMPIMWRELFAVLISMLTWGESLQGKRVLFSCDNMAVCHMVNSGTSRNVDVHKLIRVMFYVAAYYGFEFKLRFLYGCDNVESDALSRLEYDIFINKNPNADPNMSLPNLDLLYYV